MSVLQLLPGPLQFRFQLFDPFLLRVSPQLLPHGPLPFRISPRSPSASALSLVWCSLSHRGRSRMYRKYEIIAANTTTIHPIPLMPSRNPQPGFRKIHLLIGTSVEMGKRKGQSCYTSGNSYRVLQLRLAIIGSIARERGGTMEHSAELRDLTVRFYEAVNAGDLSFVERHVSRDQGALFVGTDPNEWWEGYEAFVEAMRAQEEAIEGDGPQIVPEQIQAYREGRVGWVIDRDTFQLPNGKEVPFRNSAVFLQEGGEWKLVHAHASIGVSNEEMFGENATAS